MHFAFMFAAIISLPLSLLSITPLQAHTRGYISGK
jgi:hypothetical protein